MTTIMVAVILICIITIISLGLVLINNRDRRKQKADLLEQFNKAKTDHVLSFTQKEVLENDILGLDEKKSKLLILKRTAAGKYDAYVKDISQLKACTHRNVFNTIDTGNIKHFKSEEHVEKIMLVLGFRDETEPVSVFFYDKHSNYPDEIPVLNQKARQWESILSYQMENQLTKSA